MARQSKARGISWTDETVNPFAGCAWRSPACDSCWARAAAHLHRSGEGLTKKAAGKIAWSGIVREYPEKLQLLARMKHGRKVAIGLMGDVGYEGLRPEYFRQIWEAMARAPQHTYQLLTKRPERLLGLIKDQNPHWIGVTAENQDAAEGRIPVALQIPAGFHYVSCEPLLGPIEFEEVSVGMFGALRPFGGASPDTSRLDWVIVGGESGPGSRVMQVEWVVDIFNQCQAARVPFHFKSWGDWIREDIAESLGMATSYLSALGRSRIRRIGEHSYFKVGAKHSGRMLLGREWLEFPEARQQ